MNFVLDASLTLSWFFEDERSEYAHAVKRSLAGLRALVPWLWHVEVANGLVVAAGRKRVTVETVHRAPDVLRRLPIDTDPDQPAMQDLIVLSQKHTLSAYDALYVRLAVAKNLPVATLDQRIVDACRAESTPIFKP